MTNRNDEYDDEYFEPEVDGDADLEANDWAAEEPEPPVPVGTRRLAPREERSYEDYAPVEPPTAPVRRGYGCADVFTALFLLMTILIASMTILLIANPHTPLNPLPPPTNLIIFVPITETPLPTYTPSITFTPEPPTPTVPTPTASLTPSLTPSATPTATFTPVFSTGATDTADAALAATASPQFTRSPRPFTASLAYQQNATNDGCAWQSIAGSVVDTQGIPVKGLAVRITSADESIDEVHFSGEQPRFGESGFEIFLGTTPEVGQYTVRLLGRTGQVVSEDLLVVTRDTCEENVLVISFAQNHGY